MDIVKVKAKKLMRFSRYELKKKAKELKLRNINNAGRIKLAVLIAVSECNNEEDEESSLHFI